MDRDQARRLVALAYEQGWRDACDDHLEQGRNPLHPIGSSKHRGVDPLLTTLDPYDVLGLRSRRFGLQAPTTEGGDHA